MNWLLTVREGPFEFECKIEAESRKEAVKYFEDNFREGTCNIQIVSCVAMGEE